MTTTATPRSQSTTGSQAGPRSPRPQPAAASRTKRRPALVAASLALVATGGAAGAYLLTATSDAQPVLAVTKTIQRGEVIERGDLTTAQATRDPAIHTVPADQIAKIVGKRAATDLPAGLLPAGAVTDKLTPATGKSLVGLQLKLAQLPASPLRPGDRVRLVQLPAENAPTTRRPTPSTEPTSATVVSTQGSDDGQSARVDVEVSTSAAAAVATDAALGRLVLIVDSRER